jgi:hypothetical protein
MNLSDVSRRAEPKPIPPHGARVQAGAGVMARPGYFSHVDAARAALRKRDDVCARAEALYAAQAAYEYVRAADNPFDAVTEQLLHDGWAFMWGVMVKADMERTGQLALRDKSRAYAELMGGGA